MPKWPRRLITCWLLFHLLAIVTAPASVAPASDLARAGWNVCRPYLQALYLNHGYHFFAPDPGESTLLSFAVEKPDGTVVEDTIPHRRIWPRLLYHRHFMLTESLGFVASVSESRDLPQTGVDRPATDSAEPSPGPVIAPAGISDTATGPEPSIGLLGDWYQSYADCLLNQYGGHRVTLTRVVHYLPQIEWMQESIAVGEPLTLNEPQSFDEFPVGTFAQSTGSQSPGRSPHGNRLHAPMTDRDRPDLAQNNPGGRP